MLTYIGMGALLVGCIMIAAGWQSGVKGKIMGQGLILIVAGTCIGIGGNPSRDMPDGSPGLVALGFLSFQAANLGAGLADHIFGYRRIVLDQCQQNIIGRLGVSAGHRQGKQVGIFNHLYSENPEKATEWYYKFSCDTDLSFRKSVPSRSVQIRIPSNFFI